MTSLSSAHSDAGLARRHSGEALARPYAQRCYILVASDRARAVAARCRSASCARADAHHLQPEARAAAPCRQRGHVYILFALVLVYVVAPLRGSRRPLSLRRASSTTTPSAGSRRPSTTRAAASSAPSIRASIACATSTTRTAPSTLGDYVANPDHKSIPVREVPEQYWQCLFLSRGPLPRRPAQSVRHRPRRRPEDSAHRRCTRSIARTARCLGVGGSTLPMQFARVIYQTPPSRGRGRRSPSSSASSASGGSRPSSIAS